MNAVRVFISLFAGVNLINIAFSVNLNSLYNVDTTLSLSNSPYHVVSGVIISEGATLTIPNGIQIIFNGNYDIDVRGTINAGCSDTDTSIANNRGLYYAQKVHITSTLNDRTGGIKFDADTDANGAFCNVLFEGLDVALRYDDWYPQNTLTFDNCEFTNINTVCNWQFSNRHQFTDSYFHDLTVVAGEGSAIFNNCLFENLVTGVTVTGTFNSDNIKVYNSDINGDGSQQCLSISGSGGNAVENTTISNCGIALWTYRGDALIKYNTFTDNTVAINANADSEEYVDTIQYNNFINNGINIQLEGDTDNNNAQYNYFGSSSTEQAVIAATINDICDGYSSALLRWYPWYLTAIDFDDLSNLPTTATVSSLTCTGPDNYPAIIGNRLNIIYFANTTTTLTVANSPYYVKSNVVIQETAVLNIENGVEIVFVDTFNIDVRGTINAGCYDTDTSNTNNRGLYYAQKVHITSILNDRTGGIKFDADTDANGAFCNVLFEGLDVALRYDDWYPQNTLTFDNCEFTNINTVCYWDNSNYHQFTDSYFHDLTVVAGQGHAIFNNCLFENLVTGVTATGTYNSDNIKVYNSDINGDGSQQCLSISGNGGSAVENTTISNCGIALWTYRGGALIKYNTFTDNTVAINANANSEGYEDTIQYNNFINNGINIQLEGDTDNSYCNYNYFGSSSTDQAVIAATINDICDGYSTALATFWPWLIDEYVSMDAINQMWTFDFVNCDSINSATSYIITPEPTKSPSTPRPSASPTSRSSTSPTSRPSTSTTIDNIFSNGSSIPTYLLNAVVSTIIVILL